MRALRSVDVYVYFVSIFHRAVLLQPGLDLSSHFGMRRLSVSLLRMRSAKGSTLTSFVLRSSYFSTVLLAMSAGWPSLLSAATPATFQHLAQAIELYEQEEYTEAHTLLMGIDPDELGTAGRQRLSKYSKLAARAVGRLGAARQAYQRAKAAIRDADFTKAKVLLGEVLENEYAPIELRVSARARLAKVSLLERQASAGNVLKHPDPQKQPSTKPVVPPVVSPNVDPLAQAKKLIKLGSAALAEGRYFEAQKHFSMAAWYVPNAPLEKITVPVPAGLNVDHLPVAGVQERQVIAFSPHWVTMNLQVGVGRLLGVQSFPVRRRTAVGCWGTGFRAAPDDFPNASQDHRRRARGERRCPQPDVRAGLPGFVQTASGQTDTAIESVIWPAASYSIRPPASHGFPVWPPLCSAIDFAPHCTLSHLPFSHICGKTDINIMHSNALRRNGFVW